jgi:hypothetical protein
MNIDAIAELARWISADGESDSVHRLFTEASRAALAGGGRGYHVVGSPRNPRVWRLRHVPAFHQLRRALSPPGERP